MSSPPFDGEALLRALTAASVGFIVIGGVALGAHGFRRATKDIDIVPAPDRDNLRRLAGVLPSLEYSIMGTHEFGSDELVHPDLEALTAGGNWVLSTKFGRLDILHFVEPDSTTRSSRRRQSPTTSSGSKFASAATTISWR